MIVFERMCSCACWRITSNGTCTNHSFLMRVLNRLTDRDERLQSLTWGESPLVAELGDRDAAHKFHDEERSSIPVRQGAVLILRAVMSETIGERHASACRYKNEVPEGSRRSARRTHFQPRGVLGGNQLKISCSTCPWTSVRRRSMPSCRTVNFVWSIPSRCSAVAWMSYT